VALERQRGRRRRRAAKAKYVGPFFDGFELVLVVDGSVRSAMPKLDARAVSRISRVHRANSVAPLLCRLGSLPTKARSIEDIRATGRHPGELGAALEHVGIHGEEEFRHHGAGRRSRRIDPVRIRVVFGDCVLHHLRDRLRITAAIVRLGGF
jgi:hypothetical protein